MDDISREAPIQAAKDAAAECGGILSRSDFERVSGISDYHIYRLFPDGGWSEVLKCAGITRHPMHHERLGDDDLMREFHKVASELGRQPTWAQFSARASLSADVVRRRFGGMHGTLKRYHAWLEENEPDSPLLKTFATKSAQEKSPSTAPADVPGPSEPPAMWTKKDGIEYGAPIDFRGLRHAPINEQGVVYLFGMVSSDLGFTVEAVQGAFPDCEAKRRVDDRRNRWQRVRIEFEYRSSHFRDHGHDPNGCELIVCWEDDWADCPLEVVELRTLITQLDK